MAAATGHQPHREMTRMQKGLVDSSFEEGHYEAGIAVLAQTRSPNYTPSRSHIRQLLFIALYPSSPLGDKGKGRATHDTVALARTAPPKATSSAVVLSNSATVAAQTTLMSFAQTNSPSALLRALPSYDELGTKNPGDSGDPVMDGASEQDSLVARGAARFQQCKDCWQILRGGFIPPAEESPSVVPGSPSKRRRVEVPMYYSHSSEDGPPSTVGSTAWPVLDWLLTLFEQDETETAKDQQVKYSPLLLSHIPSTRSDSGAKWAANVPLNVVFCCFKEKEQRRRDMGGRLLTLLINLTATNLFDLPLFLNLLHSHLPTDASEFREMCSMLPPSPAVLRFKLALCQRFLSHGPASRGPSTPKAQARRPIPNRTRRKQGGVVSVDVAKPLSVDSTSHPVSSMTPSRAVLLPASEVLHLLASVSDKDPMTYLVKSQLLVAYGTLQRQTVVEERSQDWIEMLRDGRVRKAVEEAFGNQSAEGSKHDSHGTGTFLLSLISVW
ncbi:hypothetical protein BV25DRAFT_1803153 [Artomyces pyxidatus]|uniref:Uncharacterized protein n=1 Tax=Artomyces pyxidatus TaxID=48021 RepID=A0ACB8T3W0_9AGAM|nr:hypothetical protein BV25DRAFT_1803153 [Artomyces pyxidatus]